MSLRIYNTMRRAKEEFVPLTPGEVRMYVCGVTVYDLSHVGHARSAIVFDVIRRYLTFKGYRVTFVKNYTDVEDKIIRRANTEGVPASEVSERYVAEERADMAALDVLAPDVDPKATEHIREMLALVERLVAKGFAYVVDGDVYFEIRRFPAYGRLSGKDLDELLAGARVEVDERKRDPRDFALWKSAKPGEPAWESPWGPGRPGWHIECSAMAMKYLGQTFDIHGGGQDLIFPHHECEIAQAEADTGRPFARYWLHNGMLNFGAEKMSKSLGNILTIKEFVKRHDPDALRLWVLGTLYRHPLEWSEERVSEAARALETLWSPVKRARQFADSATVGRPKGEPPTEYAVYTDRFVAAMDDDFNTPEALGSLFDFGRALNRASGASAQDFVRGTRALSALAQVLGLTEPRPNVENLPAAIGEQIVALINERADARQRRDWKRADELRAKIESLGAVVKDTASGTEWEAKPR
jgi:cysteinyl-tRNA synthetase